MHADNFVVDLEALLLRYDPIGADFGDNEAEYGPEAEAIAAGLPTAICENDVLQIIHQVFTSSCGSVMAGPVARYRAIAHETWKRWQSATD